MCRGSEARPRPNGSDSYYQCPSCGLTAPRAETSGRGNRSSVAVSSQQHATEQTSAAGQPGLPSASIKLKDLPSEKGTEEDAVAVELRHPDGEPLDQRELRIMRLLYGGNSCPICARLSLRRKL